MDRRTKTVTITAMLTAFSIVLLYIASVIPSGQFAVVAIASLFVIAAVIESGLRAGLFVFVGSAVLGFLILPNKSIVLLYVIFFGYYPIIKSLIERRKHLMFEWILKIIVFNISLTLSWFAFSNILFDSSILGDRTYLIYILGNLAFVLFDIGVTKLIGLYLERISRQIKQKFR